MLVAITVSALLSSSSGSNPSPRSALRSPNPTLSGIHNRLCVLASRRTEPRYPPSMTTLPYRRSIGSADAADAAEGDVEDSLGSDERRENRGAGGGGDREEDPDADGRREGGADLGAVDGNVGVDGGFDSWSSSSEQSSPASSPPPPPPPPLFPNGRNKNGKDGRCGAWREPIDRDGSESITACKAVFCGFLRGKGVSLRMLRDALQPVAPTHLSMIWRCNGVVEVGSRFVRQDGACRCSWGRRRRCRSLCGCRRACSEPCSPERGERRARARVTVGAAVPARGDLAPDAREERRRGGSSRCRGGRRRFGKRCGRQVHGRRHPGAVNEKHVRSLLSRCG